MVAMATLKGAESQVIQRKLSMVVDRITKSAGPLWLAQKLQEEGFISTQRAADILNTQGISSSEKVSHMMEAVESKIRGDSNPSRHFEKFIMILQSEPALEDVVKALDCYQDEEYADSAENPERQSLLQYNDGERGQCPNNEQKNQSSKQKGQSFIQCTCVLCSSGVSVLAAATTALITLSHYDTKDDVDRPERSSIGGSKDVIVLSVDAIIDFLWWVLPCVVMLALAISTCTLKRSRFFTRTRNLMTVCFYSTAILYFMWKQLERGFVDDSMVFDSVLLAYYIVQNSFIFIGTTVFVLPDSTCLKATAITIIIIGGATSFGVLIFEAHYKDLKSAETSMTDAAVGALLGCTLSVGFLIEISSLSDIFSLLGIATNSERCVLFITTVFLYLGYWTFGIVRGLVQGSTVVGISMISILCSSIFKAHALGSYPIQSDSAVNEYH